VLTFHTRPQGRYGFGKNTQRPQSRSLLRGLQANTDRNYRPTSEPFLLPPMGERPLSIMRITRLHLKKFQIRKSPPPGTPWQEVEPGCWIAGRAWRNSKGRGPSSTARSAADADRPPESRQFFDLPLLFWIFSLVIDRQAFPLSLHIIYEDSSGIRMMLRSLLSVVAADDRRNDHREDDHSSQEEITHQPL